MVYRGDMPVCVCETTIPQTWCGGGVLPLGNTIDVRSAGVDVDVAHIAGLCDRHLAISREFRDREKAWLVIVREAKLVLALSTPTTCKTCVPNADMHKLARAVRHNAP